MIWLAVILFWGSLWALIVLAIRQGLGCSPVPWLSFVLLLVALGSLFVGRRRLANGQTNKSS